MEWKTDARMEIKVQIYRESVFFTCRGLLKKENRFTERFSKV